MDRQEALADDVQARGRQQVVEFSMGIMARPACPSFTAAKASSKVGHGSTSQPGYISEQMMWELAPGSPWNEMTCFMLSSGPR
jgi:hypothetical protein